MQFNFPVIKFLKSFVKHMLRLGFVGACKITVLYPFYKRSATSVWLKKYQRNFKLRPNSSGDRGVLRQIFIEEDYSISHFHHGILLQKYFEEKKAEGKKAFIVDAGANIGASTVFFSKNYAPCFVSAIEPQKNNFALAQENSAGLDCKIFAAALGSEEGEILMEDPGLSDWAFRSSKQGTTKTPMIPMATVLEALQDKNLYPLICKIDIEGSEANLFAKNHEWMEQFPLIVLELHDWLMPFEGTSRNFLKALVQYDFDFMHAGENIFCFNRKILNK